MKHPKRNEVWKTDQGIDYVFVLMVGKHPDTVRKYVMYQHLSYDERMALLAGAKILSVKLRDVKVLEREIFEESYKFLESFKKTVSLS